MGRRKQRLRSNTTRKATHTDRNITAFFLEAPRPPGPHVSMSGQAGGQIEPE
jgi:hypothetical protein